MRVHCLLLLLLPMISSCGKGELDPDTLTNNPFDPAYNGASVFVFDTTYLDPVNVGGTTLFYQAILFHVKEELFLSDAAYSVQVFDRESGITTVIDANPSNSDRFHYQKPDAVIGSPVCLELRLYNNQSAARAEEICATLQ
ncbi:MAG: hypothetical protein IPG92_11060 [Flavobacteriales bacterium]|nr:hypothetical protein [Flavobacteriales bacterium]